MLKISRCIAAQGRAILESFETAVDTIICNSSDSQTPVQFVQSRLHSNYIRQLLFR